MRMSINDQQQTEAEKRIVDQRCSNNLLAALIRHHPEKSPVKVVQIKEDPVFQHENIQLRDQVKELLVKIDEMQATIDRQRKIIVKFGESDDLVIPKFSEIMQAVCKFYGIPRMHLTGPSKLAKHTFPRQVACYLGRRMTNLSYADIGRRLCRDHTSIVHGADKIEEMLKTDMRLREDIGLLIANLKEALICPEEAA